MTFLMIFLLPCIGFCSFEEIGVSVKGKVLGEGFTVLCDNSAAVYYNPSKLGVIRKQEFSIFYQDIYNLGLLSNIFIGYIKPRLGRGAVGMAWVRMGTTSKVDFMNYSENTFIFAYGQKLTEKLSIGGNIKFFYVDYDYKATGYGLDLSCTYKLSDMVQTGLVLKNLLSTGITWQTKIEEELPKVCNIGVCSVFRNFYVLGGILYLQGSLEPSVGVGCKLLDTIDLVFGVRLGQKENSTLNTGFEFQSKKLRFAIGVEYHRILGFNTFFEFGYRL